MAGRNLSDTEIKWTLSVDAQGAQGEIQAFSSKIQNLKTDNEELKAAIKLASAEIREQEKELKNLEKQGLKNSKEYQSLSIKINDKKFAVEKDTKAIENNRKAIDTQNKKIQEVIKTMKVEDMTMSQLRKRARELQGQLDNTSKSLSPESYAKLEKELNSVRGRMDQLKQSTGALNKEAEKTPSILRGGLMVLAGKLMEKALGYLKDMVKAAREWVAEGIRMASTAEGVATAFSKLGRPGLLKNLREETKGLLNDFVLMKAAVRAEGFKIPLEQLGTLLKFAQQSAQETGESVDDLTESIIDGIGKKSSKALVGFGISVERLQEETRKTGDYTTAAIKLVNEELEKQGDLALTSADKATRASVKWQNAQMEIGKHLLGVKNTFNRLSGNVADWFSEMFKKNLPGLMKWLEDIVNGLIDIYNTSEIVRVSVVTWTSSWRTAGSIVLLVIKDIGDSLVLLLGLIKSVLSFDVESSVAAVAKWGKGVTLNLAGAVVKMKEIAVDGVKAINSELQKVDFTSMTGDNTPGTRGPFTTGDGGSGSGSGRGSGSGSTPGLNAQALKNEMEERLKVIDEMLSKEINLLKKSRMEGIVTEQEYNDRVEELTVEALNKKMAVEGQEASRYIQYESQMLDAQLRQQENADKLMLQELTKARDEQLKLLDSARNTQLELLQETENDQKLYALRAQEIELNTAAAREAAVKEFGKTLERAEFQNALNRRKAIEDNSKQILDAEASTLKARATLNRQYAKSNYDFERLYNIKNREQRREEELAILERYRQEDLMTEESYLAAVSAVDKKYRDEILKARQQAALTTMKESYGIELENLALLHEQKMLSEEEYEQAVMRMRLKYASQYASQYVDLLNQTSRIVADLMQAETTNVEARYDAEIAAAQGNREQVERLEREKAQKKLEVEKKYADVQFAITAAEIIASTAMAIMQAFAQLGPVAGAIAGALVGAAGIAQLLVAGAQRKKVKSMTLAGAGASEAPPTGKITLREGFAEGGHNVDWSPGGYTAPGPKYSQAGWLPVHSGEYVVASDELARPDVAGKVRYIESLRRSRMAGKRTAPGSGFAEGGHNPEKTAATLAAERKTFDSLAKAIQRLADGDIVVNYGITEMEAAQRRKQQVESIFSITK